MLIRSLFIKSDPTSNLFGHCVACHKCTSASMRDFDYVLSDNKKPPSSFTVLGIAFMDYSLAPDENKECMTCLMHDGSFNAISCKGAPFGSLHFVIFWGHVSPFSPN